ncbi:Asp-tRNA(Asn)/Glu-tRNA(Gln) amidotransferase subunit GatB [Spiroplasma endosymbiont of Crioceris asparagi]|uniref:Asp-tRNA(Asn)/Glu-tRNA(Gln) amidotransferase subunit GatB n=1 Tax=Spiroplasma endosymbiont of Crioceris asparagi TaxID=3066286 RepID=UPI0030CCD950
MNNLEIIIGIENHVELKTKSKMFSKSAAEFNVAPNTSVDERVFGLPGALPSVNKKGVELALLACNGLNMEIDTLLRFDRKNYFYPDLAKGFQITQNFFPIGKNGYLEIEVNGKNKKIDIERLHIEEDTAKQIHKDDKTYLDYNRSGVGLVEIVTRPVLRGADEAVAYLEKLRETLLYLGISDVKMNEGSLRCDINISLRPYGVDKFGSKVEIKNLNSFNNVKKAIDFEIKRQTEMILNNEIISQETRRFDEKTQETILMRSKGDALDYKYFAEPNIFPIQLDKNWVNNVIKNSPELPSVKRNKYLNKFGLNKKEIDYILADYDFNNIFESLVQNTKTEPKKVFNLLSSDIQSILNLKGISFKESNFNVENISKILNLLNEEKISSKHVKVILQILSEKKDTVENIIDKNNLKLISDEKSIINILEPIILKNTELIKNEFNNRPERVLKTIMGSLMKETQGNVSPSIAQKIIDIKIKEIVK